MVATQRKSAPRPGNGGARQGSGPLRQVMTWKPFSAPKGESTSYIEVAMFRCNHCGAIGWDSYYEAVARPMDITLSSKHEAQPIQHRDDCPMKEG